MFFHGYQVRALAGINLEIAQGAIFAVLGPPDSGKTTLLRIIAGQLRASEGSARVLGRNPRRPAAKARIGYLPQPNERPAARPWWKRFFGDGAVDRPASTEERLGKLRAAIVGQRDLVVLDEPFSGLESAACDEVSSLIRALADRGKTVVFSSKLIDPANGLCNGVTVLYGGAIQAAGTMETILAPVDAIRYLGPVLAPAAAQRVAEVLRSEVRTKAAAPAPAAKVKMVPMPPPPQQDRLAHLTKPR